MGQKQMCCSTSIVQGLKPVMMMLVVQAAYVGMNISYKLVAEVGMNFTILVAYRNMFSAALMLPFALIFERNRPKLTLGILFQGFISGLLGMEKLALGTRTGRAKIVGTLVCVGGTMIFTFYKGHEIVIWSTDVNLLRKYSHQNSHVLHRNTRTQLLGSVLALCSSISFALWLIFQKKMTRDYPCQYSSTALMSIMASMQSTVFALCRERDWSQWKLGWDIKLFTAVYSGVITSGLVLTLTAWCVRMRGPLFVAIFNPLGLLLVGLAATLLLDEKLHLGSILGGVFIICGLYIVL
ncbi:WAT1-related protein At1g25270-like isoform X2 [Pyrus x bretschneideri]|uniref:WAT1-related protein At1g25270-like isoform X2 n=1 Tax=Pyrus x bretschneideri TaxID=225117 RepID=UPI00202F5312|nr:WAT1-related protein At1g25270-like isoform X2 [Pyrus x bretschneideri]